jgi:protoporphyrinogen oxidase
VKPHGKFTAAILIPAILFALSSCRGKENPVPSDKDTYETIIVGAGLSGLTSAWFLRDRKIIILEEAVEPGGNITCGAWQGWYYSHGPLYYSEPETEMQQFIRDLNLNPVKIPAPLEATGIKQHIYSATNLLGYMSASERDDYVRLYHRIGDYMAMGVKNSLIYRPGDMTAYPALEPLSADAWLQQENYSPTITGCLNAQNRSSLSTTNPVQSFLFDIPAVAERLQIPKDSTRSSLYTFNGGMGELTGRLAELAGEKLITRAHVTAITTDSDSLVSVTCLIDGTARTIRARSIILTVPAPQAASLVTTGLSDNARSTLASVTYTSLISLNIFTSERFLTDTWSVTCADNSFVAMYDEIRPQSENGTDGKGILTLHFAPSGPADSSFLYRSDGEIVNKAYADLSLYYPGLHSSIEGYGIKRIRWYRPVTGPGYRSVIDALNRDRSVHGPIFLAGDYLVYPSVEGEFFSAYHTAKNTRAYLERKKYEQASDL